MNRSNLGNVRYKTLDQIFETITDPKWNALSIFCIHQKILIFIVVLLEISKIILCHEMINISIEENKKQVVDMFVFQFFLSLDPEKIYKC